MRYYITDQDRQIAISLLEQRVYRDNMTIEDARSKPPRKLTSRGWDDYKHLAKSNNISYATYVARLDKQNMTHYQAATTPLIQPIVKINTVANTI